MFGSTAVALLQQQQHTTVFDTNGKVNLVQHYPYMMLQENRTKSIELSCEVG